MGKMLPDRALQVVGGSTINLAKLESLALIRFWGLWCPVCERDEDNWREVVRAMRGRGDLQVMTVHSGPVPSTGPDLETWAANQADDVRVPVIDDRQRLFTEEVGVPGVPLVLLVNRQSKIFDTAWTFKSARGVRSFLARATYLFDRAD
jgi:thiol-disulfide isomerase/thioredoxin